MWADVRALIVQYRLSTARDGEGILQLEIYWKNVSIIPRTLKIAATTAIQTKFPGSNSDELCPDRANRLERSIPPPPRTINPAPRVVPSIRIVLDPTNPRDRPVVPIER